MGSWVAGNLTIGQAKVIHFLLQTAGEDGVGEGGHPPFQLGIFSQFLLGIFPIFLAFLAQILMDNCLIMCKHFAHESRHT